MRGGLLFAALSASLVCAVLAEPAASERAATVVLTVQVDGIGKVKSKDGQISCPGSCSGKYDEKTSVSLTAVPGDGQQLAAWKGCDSEKGTTCTLVMTKDRTVKASFVASAPPPPPPPPSPQPGIQLTPLSPVARLAVGVSGNGHVTSEPAGISCPPTCQAWFRLGTRVHLTPTAAPGWIFGAWEGDCSDFEDCFVQLDGSRVASIVFGLNTPPPPSVRISTPARDAFFERGDLTTSGLVTAPAGLAAFCVAIDASTIPTPCSGAGVVTGATFHANLISPQGHHTIDAWVRDSRGRTAHDSVPIEIADLGSGVDIATPAISITQGAQEYFPYEITSSSGPTSARYTGVQLARHMPTVVRVFARATAPHASVIHAVRALLYGFGSGGILPGSPLLPYASRDLHGTYNRNDPGGAFTFDLPPSWTDGTIRLLAVVNPLELGSSIPEANRTNNTFELTGIAFNPMEYAAIGAARMCYWQVPDGAPRPSPSDPTPAGGSLNCPASPADTFGELRAMMPTRIVGIDAYAGDIDITPAVYCTQAWKDAGRCDHIGDVGANLNDAIQEWDLHTRGPRIGRALGVQTNIGGWAPTREWAAVYNAIVNSGNPRTDVAHEYLHTLGFWHASNCGLGLFSDRGPEDLSWPDGRGGLLGEGLDRRYTGNLAAPYRIYPYTGPYSGMYDFMSYCATSEDLAWISTRNWDALVGRFRHDPPSFTPVRRRQAVGPTLRVNATLTADGQATIDRVEPGTDGPSALDASSPYALVVLDDKGGVIATTHVAAVEIHTHHGKAWVEFSAEVPATGAAYVELRKDDAVLARAARSPNAPAVTIVSPQPGTRLPGTGTITVAWTATDADGNPLVARVDYSLDGGTTWKALTVDAAGGTAALHASLFAASKTARIRVVVNDGFNETTATSGSLQAAGQPPIATIATPTHNVRIDADNVVVLSGTGSDDRGEPIADAKMAWYDGRRLLGHGSAVGTMLPAGKRTVRLVVTDRLGRTASDTLKVTVLPVAPLFLGLKSPSRVASRARTLVLRTGSTIPATLGVSGHRYVVGRKVRSVRVGIRPGRTPLRLVLSLRAYGRTTTDTVVVRRS